jgi:peroxiredoxin
MRRFSIATSTVLLCGLATGPAAAQAQAPAAASPPPAIKVGEALPDFSLPYLVAKEGGGVETRQAKLADYLGKTHVVLAFFPAAFSPGCTAELARFGEQAGEFNASNTTVLGVSVDSTWANKAFREQLGVEFPILSDWKKEVSRKLGILNEETGFARRTTFVIDTTGIVRHIDQDRGALDPTGALAACRLLRKP